MRPKNPAYLIKNDFRGVTVSVSLALPELEVMNIF